MKLFDSTFDALHLSRRSSECKTDRIHFYEDTLLFFRYFGEISDTFFGQIIVLT